MTQPTGPTRRGLLKSASAVAVTGVAASVASAAPAEAAGYAFLAGDPALHLLRRATFGPTPASYAHIRRVGTQAWLEQQLRPATIADTVCTATVNRFAGLRDPIWKVRDRSKFGSWDQMFNLQRATIVRAAWSNRQLFEVMVELWSNHLNITCPASDVWDSRAHFDAYVVRRHALGSFSDLLVATTLHPAMLRYLDNASSTKSAPNENLGRELLELHTVGVGAFTESDVKNSSRILTGLSTSSDTGEFLYKPQSHYVGPVQVMGFRHPNASPTAGQQVAVDYLRYLALHPATARMIATKLVVRFVSDTPSPVLVNRLARTYLVSTSAIAPVLRQLFASAEFAASAGLKVKRPLEDLVSTLRILGALPDASGIEGMRALGWMAESVGQAPLAWHPPNGYPDVAAAWQSTGGTLRRWNMHLSLAAHWWPATLRTPKPRQLLPTALPTTHGALVDVLAQRLVFRALTPPHRAAILRFLEVGASTPVTATSAAVTWRLPWVAALILDSPYFQLR